MRLQPHLVLLLLLAACSDSSEPTVVPPTFGVSPTAQWAGGTVLVRSQFFDGLDSLPPVTAAGIEMAVTRVDDSTLSATLPSIPTQTAAVEVVDGATSYLVDSVGIVGFRDHWISSPTVSGNPVMIKATGGPLGISGTDPQPDGIPIGLLALDQRRVILAPGVGPVDAFSARGAGVTFDSSRYILRDSTGWIAEWQLIPSRTLVDTVPAAFQSPYARQIVRLSRSVWLNTSNHVTSVVRSNAPTISVTLEDPWHYTLSVAADRAIVNGAYPAPGAVVFRMSTGDTLYRLPARWVQGAAFTADGATLFVAVGCCAGSPEIVVVQSANGAMLDQAALPISAQEILGLGLARHDSRLLVAVQRDSAPDILVYDAATLALLGRLDSPPEAEGSVGGWLDADIIADDASSTAYVMGAGGYVWEFDLLP